MGFRNRMQSFGILSGLVGMSLLAYSAPTRAIPEFLVSVDFPQSAPSGGGTLSRTYGGGSRSGSPDAMTCLEQGEEVRPLTALVPESTVVKTADGDPTLFIYIPQKLARETIEATVVISKPAPPRRLPEEVYVGKTIIPNALEAGGGIVRYKLEGANLQPDQTYTWSFSVHCNSEGFDLDHFVQGLFERVDRSVASPLELTNLNPADTVAKAEEYAAKEIWNETANLVAQVRRDRAGEWANLLESINLSELVSVPFIPCDGNGEYCVPEPEDLTF